MTTKPTQTDRQTVEQVAAVCRPDDAAALRRVLKALDEAQGRIMELEKDQAAPAVPDELTPMNRTVGAINWAKGWNACRQAMLASAPTPPAGYDKRSVDYHGTPYVLMKCGYFYAHNSRGYVSRVELAELYDEGYAKRHADSCEDVKAFPVTEFISDPEELQDYLDRIEVMRLSAIYAVREVE